MARVLLIVVGLLLVLVGVCGLVGWQFEVVRFLKAAVVMLAIVVGLALCIFGVSELRAPREEPLPAEPSDAQASSDVSESERRDQ